MKRKVSCALVVAALWKNSLREACILCASNPEIVKGRVRNERNEGDKGRGKEEVSEFKWHVDSATSTKSFPVHSCRL